MCIRDRSSNKVEFLKARLRDTNPSISLDRARLVTEFYRTPSVESPISRKAHLLEYLLKNMKIFINPQSIFVGDHGERYRSCLLYTSREVILKVENLTRKGAFKDVSFDLKKGEVLGITGLLGSGRGELGDALFGIAPASGGKITLNGKPVSIKSIGDAMKARIGYVPEDRLTQGLFLDCTIQENTVAASIRKYLKKGRLNYREMYDATQAWIRKIGCNAKSPKPLIRTLSGGNAQKMVIAKWLNTNPALLVLNGPTVGVDIGSKADIHKILRELAEQGVGIIVISDDVSELIQNCSKILIMKNGKTAGSINSKELDETRLSRLLTGEEETV